jgi:hypothetical protein
LLDDEIARPEQLALRPHVGGDDHANDHESPGRRASEHRRAIETNAALS